MIDAAQGMVNPRREVVSRDAEVRPSYLRRVVIYLSAWFTGLAAGIICCMARRRAAVPVVV